jgi:hypothetical protein
MTEFLEGAERLQDGIAIANPEYVSFRVGVGTLPTCLIFRTAAPDASARLSFH